MKILAILMALFTCNSLVCVAENAMTEERFWRLMTDIGKMGKFIAAVPNKGASANTVGHFAVAFDGKENVFEKKGCKDHIHLYPQHLSRVHFSYADVGYGPEPVIELQDQEHKTFLKLYYAGSDAIEQYQQLIKANTDLKNIFYGKW